VDFRLGLEVWYQEPRLTCDPELEALSPFCTYIPCKRFVTERMAKVEGFSDQSECLNPVLNVRQELPKQSKASSRIIRNKVGCTGTKVQD